MLLHLTRHGETEYNVLGRYCGSTDIPLNETGIAQARELANRLLSMKFDVIVSSPMLRARQTSDIVCSSLNMPYSVSKYFTERNMGVYEGLTREEAKERYPNMWNRQCTSKPDDAPDGGETLRQACGRIDNGMEQLIQEYKDKCVLLICHGFAARAVHRFCNNLSFEEMGSFILGNCNVVSYTVTKTIEN